MKANDERRAEQAGEGECPKPHEVVEGVADITALGDAKHRYMCLDCGHKFEGRFGFRPADLPQRKIPSGKLQEERPNLMSETDPMREYLKFRERKRREIEFIPDNVTQPAPGWTCKQQRHLDPDTGREFINPAGRDSCEICGRSRD